MSFYSAPDRIYFPVRIHDGNNVVRYSDTNGTSKQSFTVPTGIYWCHVDGTLDGNGYPSLLLEIASQIESVATNTYEYQMYDVSGEDLKNASLKIKRASGSGDFTFHFTDSEHTLDARFLGFPWFQDTDDRSDKTSSSGELNGEISQLGVWQTKASIIHADHRIVTKEKLLQSDDGPNARVNGIKNIPDARRFQYHDVPGAFVYGHRADNSSLASDAGLVQYDTANGLELAIQASGRGEFICVFEEGDHAGSSNQAALAPVDEAIAGDTTIQNQTEILSASDKIETKSVRQSQMQYGGEFYSISWEWDIKDRSVLTTNSAKYIQ